MKWLHSSTKNMYISSVDWHECFLHILSIGLVGASTFEGFQSCLILRCVFPPVLVVIRLAWCCRSLMTWQFISGGGEIQKVRTDQCVSFSYPSVVTFPFLSKYTRLSTRKCSLLSLASYQHEIDVVVHRLEFSNGLLFYNLDFDQGVFIAQLDGRCWVWCPVSQLLHVEIG